MVFPTTNTKKLVTLQSIFNQSPDNFSSKQALKHKFSQALYSAGRTLISTYMHLALSLDILHHAHLPEGPKILAANHPTTTDPFYLPALLNEPVSVLVTASAFEVPVFGNYLREAGHIPAVRGSGGSTVDAVTRVIEAGRTTAIFPEGSLSPLDGSFGRPHTGLARVALRTGAPVIPVGISLQRDRIHITRTETQEGVVIGHLYPAGPYAVTVGHPIYLTGSVEDHKIVRDATSQVMTQIQKLAIESGKRLRLVYPNNYPGDLAGI